MSRITKAICDQCGMEMDITVFFYTAKIISQSLNFDKGRQIMNGDYCKKCFEKMIKEELNL